MYLAKKAPGLEYPVMRTQFDTSSPVRIVLHVSHFLLTIRQSQLSNSLQNRATTQGEVRVCDLRVRLFQQSLRVQSNACVAHGSPIHTYERSDCWSSCPEERVSRTTSSDSLHGTSALQGRVLLYRNRRTASGADRVGGGTFHARRR